MERPGLPPISTNLVVMLLFLQVQRDEKGNQWCSNHGIGAMRRMLGGKTKDSDAKGQAHNGAFVVLRSCCELCPVQCGMQDWVPPVTH
jgi:hypothetical protein